MLRVIRCIALFVVAIGIQGFGGTSAAAQGGDWTWMGGSSTAPTFQPVREYFPGQAGVYGKLGVAAAGNVPGARMGAVGWTDSSNNLWLFGGIGYDSNRCPGYLNDLWKFDPSKNQWTWISGTSLIIPKDPISGTPGVPCGGPFGNGTWGSYGTKGVAAAGNVPGGRSGASGWIDSGGNLWIFGGFGYDAYGFFEPLNDLWEFNPSTSEWTWVTGYDLAGPMNGTGTTAAVCGPSGTPATDSPQGDSYGTSWTDNKGNFWLLSSSSANGSPLWEFSPSTTEWTLVSGFCFQNGFGSPGGAYGIQGQPAAGNLPGGRLSASSWADKNGNLWIMGGGGWDPNEHNGILNDLWTFNPSISEWTWMAGSATLPTTNAPVYGTQGTQSPANSPGQVVAASTWTDSSGNFWLLSGQTLWEFNPAAKAWTWVGGSDVTWQVEPGFQAPWQSPAEGTGEQDWPFPGPGGVYGTLGQADPANIPGARQYATTWTDNNGNLWLFGGIGYDSTGAQTTILNDLWKYVPTPTFTVATSQPTLTVTSNGQGTVALTVTSQNGFQSEVSFACSGLPTGASCSFNPATVTPTGGTATTQLTISAGSQASAQRPDSRRIFPAATLAVAFCLLGIRRRRGLQTWLLLMFAGAGLGLLSACGDVTIRGSNQAPGTPGTPAGPTTSTVTVTATSGSIQQTAMVSLTVN
jgi:N-acetylneuraminic acid mutarotase